MAAASTSKSAQHALESMVLGTNSGGTAVTATSPLTRQQVTVTIPTCAAGVAGNAVTTTVTGAALGDICLIGGPTVALAHQVLVTAFVSATDTVSISAAGDATGFTGASKVYNLIVLKQS
jgi:hypothetical protein